MDTMIGVKCTVLEVGKPPQDLAATDTWSSFLECGYRPGRFSARVSR